VLEGIGATASVLSERSVETGEGAVEIAARGEQ